MWSWQRAAADGQPQEDGAVGVDLVHDVADVDLLLDRPSLARRDVAAVVARGDELVERGIGQQVAGKLLDDELVERLVGVERLDHPVAIGPDLAIVVQVQAMGVAVAGGVEPEPGHVLAVARRVEQPVHELLISLVRAIGQEGIDLLGRRGQAGQVEEDAADQGRRVGLGRGVQPLGLEPGQDETVDRIPRPAGILDGGQVGLARRLEGPVRRPRRPLLDPSAERLDLLGRQLLAELLRGHLGFGIVGLDPEDQLAFVGLARNDRDAARLQLRHHALLGVEPQPGLARLVVGTVAGEAIVREDRADIAREIHRAALGLRPGWPGLAGAVPLMSGASARATPPKAIQGPARTAARSVDKRPCLTPWSGGISAVEAAAWNHEPGVPDVDRGAGPGRKSLAGRV